MRGFHHHLRLSDYAPDILRCCSSKATSVSVSAPVNSWDKDERPCLHVPSEPSQRSCPSKFSKVWLWWHLFSSGLTSHLSESRFLRGWDPLQAGADQRDIIRSRNILGIAALSRLQKAVVATGSGCPLTPTRMRVSSDVAEGMGSTGWGIQSPHHVQLTWMAWFDLEEHKVDHSGVHPGPNSPPVIPVGLDGNRAFWSLDWARGTAQRSVHHTCRRGHLIVVGETYRRDT